MVETTYPELKEEDKINVMKPLRFLSLEMLQEIEKLRSDIAEIIETKEESSAEDHILYEIIFSQELIVKMAYEILDHLQRTEDNIGTALMMTLGGNENDERTNDTALEGER